MRHLVFVFCLLCSTLSASPDSTTVKVLTVKAVPASFLKLRISNDSIAKNDRLNEELVDMVQVDERDRKVPTLYTTHQSYGFGWFTRMIGFYWHPVDRMRYKFVGTNLNGLNMPGEKDELTEHDINFNLIPHVNPYLHFVYRGRTRRRRRRWQWQWSGSWYRSRRLLPNLMAFVSCTCSTNKFNIGYKPSNMR